MRGNGGKCTRGSDKSLARPGRKKASDQTRDLFNTQNFWGQSGVSHYAVTPLIVLFPNNTF